MTETKSKNVLTHAQFYQLCNWLKEQDLDKAKIYTMTQLCHVARTALGSPVSPNSIGVAMSELKIELPKRPIMDTSFAGNDRIRVIAKVLVDVLNKLGEEVPPELNAIMWGKKPSE